MNLPDATYPTSSSTTPLLFHRTLFSKVAFTFLAVLTLMAAVYGYLTVYSTNRYFEATYQRLNQDVAAHIAKFAQPFINQQVNKAGAEAIFFNAMVTNPSAEVYLLDSTGTILVYHAPAEKIKLNQVDLTPIRQFIQQHGQLYIKGDNPRNPAEKKIFSAAEVIHQHQSQGYVYVILGSEEYGSAMTMLRQNYVLRWGLMTMLFTLFAALLIGLLIVYYQTRNLRRVIHAVNRFSNGDLTARIQVGPSSEVAPLANTFNDMANRLTQTIDNLRQSEQVRRDLVANVSHDLRTPIAAIHGYAETLTLKANTSEAQTQQYIGIILQSTKTLMKRVNELFELSKLEAKESPLHCEPFILADLLMEAFAKFQVLAERRHLTFTCIQCDQPSLTYADIGLIERSIQNLVENAVQYAPEGSLVQIELARQHELVRVSVLNATREISEPVLAYLQQDTSARPANVGLGIALVRKILILHQTNLQVERLTDERLNISFTLPVYTKQIQE